MKSVKSFILWLITPIQKLLQRSGRQESKMTSKAVIEFMKYIDPGDILVCYESGRPTSKLIKGEYDHVAIVSATRSVIDAVGDKFVDGVNLGGVREVDLMKWLYQMDKVALIRPNLPNYIRESAAKEAPKYIGIGYDYVFEYGSEKIYCSELPYLCYRIFVSNFMSDTGDEILPQEYRDRCNNDFILIYEFKG